MKRCNRILLDLSKVVPHSYERTRSSLTIGDSIASKIMKGCDENTIQTLNSTFIVQRNVNMFKSSSISCNPKILYHPRIVLSAGFTQSPRAFSTHTTTTTTKASTTSSSTTDTNKTVGDHFLDNLGKIFLSIIGMVIASLVRSSYTTSDRTALRTKTEILSALDPFEIDDLRVANDEFTPEIFRRILDRLEELGYFQKEGETKLDYTEFVSIVMMTMQGIKNEGFTIQLGHLIDRVLIDIQQRKRKEEEEEEERQNISTHDNDTADGSQDENMKMDLMLLLTALTLTLHSSVKERVEILYEIMQKMDDPHRSQKERVTLQQIQKMIGYLQQTCQLVPDAQIVETTNKYPYQTHKIGRPEELVQMGQKMKKEELSKEACATSEKDCTWTCPDFHHLLRSKSICAWGECYVKTKSLDTI